MMCLTIILHDEKRDLKGNWRQIFFLFCKYLLQEAEASALNHV